MSTSGFLLIVHVNATEQMQYSEPSANAWENQSNFIWMEWWPLVKGIFCLVILQILFLTFLVVYSLFLMTELRPYITHTNSTSAITSSNGTQCQTCCLNMVSGVGCLELATYACLFSYLLEEIRQVGDLFMIWYWYIIVLLWICPLHENYSFWFNILPDPAYRPLAKQESLQTSIF